ncbi:aggregation-promoting factor C-terminal-like domain-containing protein [Actinocorallia lasiicapitis]
MALTLGTALPAQAAQHAATTSTKAVAAEKTKAKKKKSRKQRNIAIAAPMVKARGWSKTQHRCLVLLWTKESNWNHKAYNGSSGAGGIPQALPASKMRSAGKDWRTNPKTQIKWGLRYIKGRYGTPCAGWAHFRSHHWY